MPDILSQAYNYYNALPPKMKVAMHEEAQAMGVEIIQFVASKIRQGAGAYFNSTKGSYQAQQQGAKRSRIEAAKDKSNTILPAQLRLGRGAELAYQQQNILAPINFKTGEPSGRSVVRAFSREHMLYKQQTVALAFAYKMQLEQPSYKTTESEVPVNRFVVHNVFRHVLPGTQNLGANDQYGNLTVSWNQTLGPDKSYVRRLGRVTNTDPAGTGTAYNSLPAGSGLNASLQSPYRYPENGSYMYSRMSRRALENFGWNANPMKLAAISPGSGSTTALTNLQVYANAAQELGTVLISSPSKLPRNAEDTSYGPSYYYRSQNSRGELQYNFSNEGTNPVVIDVVITRLKRGNALVKKDLLDSMVAVYQKGYMNYTSTNKGQANFSGQPPVAEDVTTNARGVFLPAKALDSYKVTTDPATGLLFDQSSHPYKQIARDQFIVAGGATRAWNMFLQPMDYDARKYNEYDNINLFPDEPIEFNDEGSSCVDDLSYIISIGMSGVPAPFIEQPGGASALPSVIDRRGSESSCSVTGMYKEHCHPVYLTMANNETYINGSLDIPTFDTGSSVFMGTADILSIANATRSSGEASALIAMGPLNTVGGG